MRLGLVRAIDRHVGVFACFVLTLVRRWLPGGKGAKSPAVRRVLFIELSEMGSAILSCPAILYTFKKHPDALVYYLIFEQNRPGVEASGLVPPHRIITISTASAAEFVRTTLAALRRIRELGIDTVFDLELFSRYSALLSGLSGATRRAGFHRYHEEGLYRGDLATHPVLYNCHMHMADNYLSLVKSVEHGGERPLTKEPMAENLNIPRWHGDEDFLEGVVRRVCQKCPAGKNAPWVVFSPSAGELLPIRAWPLDRYAELGRRLVEKGFLVVVLGADDARAHARRLVEELGREHVCDLTGETSTDEFLAVLSLCDALICADSGAAHFASLVRCPSVVLFGPETPFLYAPLSDESVCLTAGLACSPCLTATNHRKTSCTDPVCMKAIGVDEVHDALVSLLDDNRE
ncbi:MAG: glycosyltransferase family 9 protein [Desulfatibacillaceae bacterium]